MHNISSYGPTLRYTSKYTNNEFELHFVRANFGSNYECIEARKVGDYYCFDVVACGDYVLDSKYRDDASEGCFYATTGLDETSTLQDDMIMAGYLKVTGRILDGRAEVKPDDEWFDQIQVEPVYGERKGLEIQAMVGSDAHCCYRTAYTTRGIFEWRIDYIDPHFELKYQDKHGYVISIHTEIMGRKYRFNTTEIYDSVTDAWLEAIRIEKAATELLANLKQIATKYDVDIAALMHEDGDYDE